MVTRAKISRCVIELIRQAADAAAPEEACGLLFGSDDAVTEAEVARNVAENRERHFEIDPAALFAALKAERAGARMLVGYWHSHPSGDPRPSATDAAMAAPDGRLWLIVAGSQVGLWRAGRDGLRPLQFQEL